MSWDTVVNVAQGAWTVIQDGRPSAEVHASTANAVPQVDDWQSITGTRGPGVLTWNWRRINGFGSATIDVEFKLKWEYGATYRNGGAFIPNLWIEVPKCEVSWGYNANIRLTVRNPSNAGTNDAPIARLPVTVSGSHSTLLEASNVDWGFTLFGNGTWQQD